MMRFILSIYFILYLAPIIYAQDFVYQQLTKSENGLISNTIYDIYQDKRGFMWFGTEKGLVRYDGVNYKNYENSAQNGNAISNLQEDDKGRVWCQNFVGQFFYIEKDSLYFADFIDPCGSFFKAWILDGHFLCSIVLNKGIRISDLHLRTNLLKSIAVDKLETKGFGLSPYSCLQNNKFYTINLNDNALIEINSKAEIKITPHQASNSRLIVLQDNDSTTYLLAKNNGIIIDKIEHGTTTNLYEQNKGIFTQNTKKINAELFALMTSTGLYLLDNKMRFLNQGQPYFKEKNISSLFQDKEKNWWIGTIEDGILFIPSQQIILFDIESQKHSLRSFAYDKHANRMYLGTDVGKIYEFDVATKTFWQCYEHKVKHDISCLYLDTFNNSLLFTADFVYRLNLKNKQASACMMGAAKSILQLRPDQLLISTNHNLCLELLQKPDSVNIPMYEHMQPQNRRTFTYNPGLQVRTRALAFAPQQELLYGATMKGLWVYDVKKWLYDLSTSYPIQYQGDSIIASDLDYYKGKLYVSTFNQGIFIIENGKVLLHLAPPQKTSIQKIKATDNSIWFTAENNVQRYDLQTKKFSIYDIADGLPEAEFRSLLVINDTVYISTSVGLIQFDALLKDKNEIAPDVIINQVFVNQQPIPSITNTELAHYQNNIEVHFSVIAFKAGKKAKVWYSINSEDWIPLENNARVLQLPSLSWGSYTIRLRASNEDGIISEKIPVISFNIHPPFWLTWWFTIIWALALGAVFYLAYRVRVRQLESRNRLESDKILLERELQKSILASIKSQMNPHFIFNALNTIQAYIYMNDKKNATTYLGKFSDLTRMILDMSNRETIALSVELKALQLYIELEKIRFEDTFDYQLIIDKSINTEEVLIPAMIVQPFVENALKHGLLHKKNNRKLSIEFKQEEQHLIVTISDNGVGRQKAMELNARKNKSHTSFASNANQKRLELLNQGKLNTISLQYIDKEDTQGNSLGTTVILTIPI